MSQKNQPKKDKSTKTFNITNMMMADLMFFLRPMKERQQEAMFWNRQLVAVQQDIVKSLGVDQTKYSVNWEEAYQTGKIVCVKLPDPVIVKEKNDKNNNSKK